jgi:hypothetical protein
MTQDYCRNRRIDGVGSRFYSLCVLTPLLLLTLVLAGCRPGPHHAGVVVFESVTRPGPSGTDDMARVLRAAARAVDSRLVPTIVDAGRAELIRRTMVSEGSLAEQRKLHLVYATELTNEGNTEDAIRELNALETDIRVSDPGGWARMKRPILLAQAIAHLRLGEDQNCCARNTPDSCLLPIKGAGVHTQPFGSTHAIQLLERLLQDDPRDVRARWLLNVAFMTLGKYPQEVPARWRISPEVFRSGYPLHRFPNISSLTGLSILGRAGGTVVDDLDGDSRLDVLISAIGFEDQLRFFHNNGDGSFSDRTARAKLTGLTGGINMIQADYDNDGRKDVFVMRGGWAGPAGRFPSSLLRNTGAGVFEDVTKRTGLFCTLPTQTAVWLDYDSDGYLDLFVGYLSGPGKRRPCALFRNNGDGTFRDVAKQAGVDFSDVRAAISDDYNGDGRPDLFLTVGDSGRAGGGVLLRNEGGGTFSDVSRAAGVADGAAGSSALFFDYDNDGRPDLFLGGAGVDDVHRAVVEDVAADYLGLPTGAGRARLYHNRGDGTFEEVGRAAGLHRVMPGAGLNYGDLDNDGFPDLYVGTGTPALDMIVPNRMFRNAGGKVFQDVTTAGDFGHLQKGYGVAFADMNDDGQQDVFAHMGGVYYGDRAYSALFANPGGRNRWLTLQLRGVQTNRSAIGARIKVTVRTPGGKRDIYKSVCSGGSAGAGPLRQEIGLGNATAIEQVEVFWPVSRRRQRLRGLKPDRIYHIDESRERAVRLRAQPFAWPMPDGLQTNR